MTRAAWLALYAVASTLELGARWLKAFAAKRARMPAAKPHDPSRCADCSSPSEAMCGDYRARCLACVAKWRQHRSARS